jgi:hypothetical protein
MKQRGAGSGRRRQPLERVVGHVKEIRTAGRVDMEEEIRKWRVEICSSSEVDRPRADEKWVVARQHKRHITETKSRSFQVISIF